MAVSSSTATLYIAYKNVPLSTPRNGPTFLNSVAIHALEPRRICIRSSNDASSIETNTLEEADSESSIEVPKGPSSLISALNAARALRGIPITDVDHYGRLGLRRGCSHDQVIEAYRSKTEKLTSHGFEAQKLDQNLEELKDPVDIGPTISVGYFILGWLLVSFALSTALNG